MLLHSLMAIVLLMPMQGSPLAHGGGDGPAGSGGLNSLTGQAISRNDIANWLVNLGRHQGHMAGRSDPRSASLHVLALLSAATEVSPDCAEAHHWLYDLQHRLGRLDAARRALSEYVRLTPGDDAARILLLELTLADRQTAEARMEHIKAELARKPLSRAYESELHRWLATYYFEGREGEFSAREVEYALRLNPMNVATRELAYEMFGETEPVLQRVEMALQLITLNPAQANLIWDLAEFLDRESLHSQAQEWYNRAIDVHRRTNVGPVPAAFWHRLAMSYANSEDYKKAKQVADEALGVDAMFHAARLLRANAETKLGLVQAAAEDVSFVEKNYETRVDKVLADKLTGEAAEIAWFYCYHRPDPEPAMKLAKVAMSASEPTALARLAHGYALRLNGRTEEAIKALEPLAAVDQLAALALADEQASSGNRAQAITTLYKAAAIQSSGIAYNLIGERLTSYGETAIQPPLHTKVVAVLDKFQRDVFDFHKRPEDFLRFTMCFVDEPLPAVGPVDVVFRLENIGPFAITFGEGFMCRPLVAVSARLCGGSGGSADSGVSYEDYVQVLINAHPLLLPGDAVEKTVAIDVGPVRDRLVRTITQTVTLDVTALFDPVYEDGRLAAGMGTIAATPIKTIRPGIDVSDAGIAAILNRANSLEPAERLATADLLGALLADAEHALPGSRAENLPRDAVNTALAGLLADSDWRVRAHAMVAVGWSRLDIRVTNAAAPAVRREENSVVKLLAVRLFAEQHGDKFVQVLKALSTGDRCGYVRTMAESYLPKALPVQANRAVGSAAADAIP